jgi:RES domain
MRHVEKSAILPANTVVPVPPDTSALDPLIHEWEAGRTIVRCHDTRFGATEFNRTASEGRFRPVRSRRRIVGTVYGAQDDAGAIAESVFRPVPVGTAVRQVGRARLVPVMISTLASSRTLRLASLHGNGLRRVGASRAQLIDSEADKYAALAAWGQALHDCPATPDGIVWRSRHYDDSYTFVLFGDRLRRNELQIVEPPLPLAVGRGLERVMELAEQADITIVD